MPGRNESGPRDAECDDASLVPYPVGDRWYYSTRMLLQGETLFQQLRFTDRRALGLRFIQRSDESDTTVWSCCCGGGR